MGKAFKNAVFALSVIALVGVAFVHTTDNAAAVPTAQIKIGGR